MKPKLHIATNIAPFHKPFIQGIEPIGFKIAITQSINSMIINKSDYLKFILVPIKSEELKIIEHLFRFKDVSFYETNTKLNHSIYTKPVFEKIGYNYKSHIPKQNLLKIFDAIKISIPIEQVLPQKTKIKDLDFSNFEVKISGKNFVRINVKQGNLFEQDSKLASDSNSSPKGRYANPSFGKSDFDIFDLIFPSLCPPINEYFNNSIAFPNNPYPYQVDGINFLISNNCALLGDEMGLGKSIQSIIASRILFREGKIKKTIILCPKSVLTDWEKKIWEWAPELKVIKLNGESKYRRILWSTSAHIYVCTYETFKKDIDNEYAIKNFDLLILDEIQKSKNPKTFTTKAIREITSARKWGLSGTPLENKLEDLVTICETLNKNIFNKIDKTRSSLVKTELEKIFKRRRKKDVLKDLPEKVPSEIWLELLPEQRKAYDLAEREGIISLKEKGEKVTLQHVLALITALKKICNLDISSGESAKLNFIIEELEIITERNKDNPDPDKALIFSQYPNETLKKILPALKKFNPSLYHGGLSTSKRDNLVDKFQSSNDKFVMLLSLHAANSGITLTKANFVYHFDLWWNPAIKNQATDRAHRIGQAKTVFEKVLLIENSIEERIYNILKRKQKLFNEIIDNLSDEEFTTVALTSDEIFKLFGLDSPREIKIKLENQTFSTLEALKPLQFETYIETLYKKIGYQTKQTKKSNDGGVDIMAKNINGEIIIQCKHREKSSGTTGVKDVRELYGVYKSMENINKAILITNGKFTAKAKEFAQNNKVELINGSKLIGLINMYK